MALLNFIEIETKSGYRGFELHQADITNLTFEVDLIAFSAFQNDYLPVPATVIGSFYDRGINIQDLSQKPLFDFRDSFGTWFSKELNEFTFKHLICVEIVGTNFSFSEAIQNLFSVLSVLEIKGYKINSLALPLLGAGNQRVEFEEVVSNLINSSLDYLQHARYLNKICFIVKDPKQANEFNEKMNTVLGRIRVETPKGDFADGIKKEILQEIDKIPYHNSNRELLKDFRRIILNDCRSFELGGISRKLLEYLLNDMLDDRGNKLSLFSKIRLLSERGIAQWIISYMHTLRVFGNESVHNNQNKKQNPEYVSAKDLEVCLFCLQRVLSFYTSYEEQTVNF